MSKGDRKQHSLPLRHRRQLLSCVSLCLFAAVLPSSSHGFLSQPCSVKSFSTSHTSRNEIDANKQILISNNSNVCLSAKKKKGGGATASSKIQVKILKPVPGTGQPGDVVLVAPAFFNNKLRPGKLAEVISDEEVAGEQKAKDEKRRQVLDAANSMKDKIAELGSVTVGMKAGPDGTLFGSVKHKNILDELRNNFPKNALGKKTKIVSIKDANDKEVPHGGDIKELGTYTARIELLKDVETKISVVVEETK